MYPHCQESLSHADNLLLLSLRPAGIYQTGKTEKQRTQRKEEGVGLGQVPCPGWGRRWTRPGPTHSPQEVNLSRQGQLQVPTTGLTGSGWARE